MFSLIKKRPATLWIGLGVFSILLRIILGFLPTVTEYAYSRGLFRLIRWLFDFTITNFPFPLFYLLGAALLYYLGRSIFRFFKQIKQYNWKEHLVNILLGLGGFIGATIFLFFILWGYNYSRISVEEQLGLHLVAPDSLCLNQEFQQVASEAILLRNRLSQTPNVPIDVQYFPRNTEAAIRPLLTKVLARNGYPTPGRVRGRKLVPKGILLRFGIAGIYLPFIGEGHIDSGLHPLSQPFTLAHELAHGYGFGAEGTCNFWAYLTCLEADEPAIRYAGHINYLRYLLGAQRRYGKEYYKTIKQNLPQAILTDLEAIKENNAKYPDWISASPINDAFLKSQGVKDGIESYSRVIVLVTAWRRKNR